MVSSVPRLFRAHSTKYLPSATGVIANPNLQRARKPRDMPFATHQALNEWFMDRFGVGYRERALFCTGDASIASGYLTSSSSRILIEPIGDYSICYSARCKDLFAYYQFYWSAPETTVQKIRDDLDTLGFVHQSNGGLEEAASSGCEVMLVAEHFRYSIC